MAVGRGALPRACGRACRRPSRRRGGRAPRARGRLAGRAPVLHLPSYAAGRRRVAAGGAGRTARAHHRREQVRAQASHRPGGRVPVALGRGSCGGEPRGLCNVCGRAHEGDGGALGAEHGAECQVRGGAAGAPRVHARRAARLATALPASSASLPPAFRWPYGLRPLACRGGDGRTGGR